MEQDILWERKREKDCKGDGSVGVRGCNWDNIRQAKSRNGGFMDHPLGISVCCYCAEIRYGWKEIMDRPALNSLQEADAEGGGHLKCGIFWVKDFQVSLTLYHVSTRRDPRI